MLTQPAFGRRLKQLRTERGLTQAELAGEGMSTGYLSRLESGARPPTDEAVAHLARQLGVAPEDLAEPPDWSLARSLAATVGLDVDEAGELLARALRTAGSEDPLLRWQALWQVAEWRRHNMEHAEERSCLDELVALAEQLDLPELRARARARLARAQRGAGQVPAAVETAISAYRLAVDEGLTTRIVADALLALVSSLAEAGRMAEARQHADELLTVVASLPAGRLLAEAAWTVAGVRLRQGEPQVALKLVNDALEQLQGRLDPAMWVRLRIVAARLHLNLTPPETEPARRRIEEVEACLPFAGTPTVEQELLALRARLAFHTGHTDEARALLDRLADAHDHLDYQEQIRLDVLRNQLLLLGGKQDEGMRGLRTLAEQAQERANFDLAAEIWRHAAESLARAGGENQFPGV
ncbi:helix-turn-helix domain-containing protein [Nonomuraea sp. NPDC003707]